MDGHRVVRLGLRTLFGSAAHFSVVGEAGSVAEALAEARLRQPDLVIMEAQLADGSALEGCRAILAERPRTRVVMLSSRDDEAAVVASILAGAAGYVLKASEPERLIEAVATASRGGSYLDPAVAETVFAWMRRVGAQAAVDPLAGLSAQERSILPLIAEGKTNRQIAAALSLSEHTVKTYISRVLKKLHLTRRAEVAAFIARRWS